MFLISLCRLGSIGAKRNCFCSVKATVRAGNKDKNVLKQAKAEPFKKKTYSARSSLQRAKMSRDSWDSWESLGLQTNKKEHKLHTNFVHSKQIDGVTYIGLKKEKHKGEAHLAGGGSAIPESETSPWQGVGRERLENKEEEINKR